MVPVFPESGYLYVSAQHSCGDLGKLISREQRADGENAIHSKNRSQAVSNSIRSEKKETHRIQEGKIQKDVRQLAAS